MTTPSTSARRYWLGGRRAANRVVTALLLSGSLILPAVAGTEWPDEGWQVIPTQQTYHDLLDGLHESVEAEGMIVVTDAGPTEAAASRGETIPGNRVVGVFRNDFAVRAVRASVPAMIEAPIRFYVTEEEDGTATLSWKTPSHVFAPYVGEGGEELRKLAEELDAIFEAIARRTTEG
ncbi:DUF302 domain-containing protein [Litchfieldella rifensis]|uniref:DUF302 domain-containing protein n=1 Tax=Litchfieldella rifensis TaxID=762643 RepID=A0ABV7LRD1_9GAMM